VFVATNLDDSCLGVKG